MLRGNNLILDKFTLPLYYEHMQDKLLDFTNLQENSQETGVHGVEKGKKIIGFDSSKMLLVLILLSFSSFFVTLQDNPLEPKQWA